MGMSHVSGMWPERAFRRNCNLARQNNNPSPLLALAPSLTSSPDPTFIHHITPGHLRHLSLPRRSYFPPPLIFPTHSRPRLHATAHDFTSSTTAIMSAEEDLIDYSDEELQTTDAAPAAANGEAKKDVAATGATDAQGSYAGVHSTSFRDFLLKPELLKAITDCGFEHPSMS